MYVPEVEKAIKHAYKSKYNLTHENQVTFLMIGDGEKWHHLTVGSLSALLKGITSKHKEDSYFFKLLSFFCIKKIIRKTYESM